MNRFKFLTLGLFGLILLGAGCQGGTGGIVVTDTDPDAEQTAGGIYTAVQSVNGTKTLVRPSNVHLSGQTSETFPVLNDPTFVSVEEAEAEAYLYDDLTGYAVQTAEGSRFYPMQILAWHGVVNDEIDDAPVVVLYSPLSDVGGVFAREAQARFEMGNYVWNNDTLFFDSRSQSLWSPLLRQAVYGSRAGDSLESVPFVTMTWDEWRRAHPDGQVLSSNTGFERSYDISSYGRYLLTHEVIFDLSSEFVPALAPKAVVGGVRIGDAMKAYQEGPVVQQGAGAVNDMIGAQPVIVWTDSQFAMRVHERPEGTSFVRQGNGLVDQDGTVWFLADDGRLTDGTTTLERLPLVHAFWFAWQASYPNTELYANVEGKGFVDGPFALEEGEGAELEEAPGVEINASFDGASPEINVTPQ